MKAIALLFILYASILCGATLAEVNSGVGVGAEQEIVRLQPEVFSHLPEDILKELKGRGCTVPQSYASSDPHNVIRGQFQVKGQLDWAVLCSTENTSSILVIWGGDESRLSEIAGSPDKNWLQVIGDGEIGYSRRITSIGCNAIVDLYRASGGPKPPLCDHEAIDDAFLEKGSIVYYWHDGNWTELMGAD